MLVLMVVVTMVCTMYRDGEEDETGDDVLKCICGGCELS